ncbi:DNA glycosylase [Sordaria brevicollis]|uniref:Adenine DNA glycosylase n=1 Tax=Sordaria brevicollis TaxID=83679 RepID=A0AAE0PK13_SORBR|nr:DNA glycosylase [Sordaria brevicollis]
MTKDVQTHYNQWLAAFPTMDALSKASPKQVEELLASKNTERFHVLAMQLCGTKYNNPVGIPTTVKELQDLPGIGPATAGLVASVVFGRPEPMVTWNISRVLCRQLGIRANPNTKDVKEVVWEAAKRLVEQVAWDGVEAEAEEAAKKLEEKKGGKRKAAADKGIHMVRSNRGQPPLSDRPGRWGQALAELGGTICLLAEKPKCELCPIQATCRAYAEGLEIARQKGMVERPQQSNPQQKESEALRKRKVVDIEDAACTLCPAPPPPPPPPPPPASRPLADVSPNIIKLEAQHGTPANIIKLEPQPGTFTNPIKLEPQVGTLTNPIELDLEDDTPTNPIKLELPKDEENADPEVQFLASLPLYPMGENAPNNTLTPTTTITSTNNAVQAAQAPQPTQTQTQMSQVDENTIIANFYEKPGNEWLKARVEEASRGELKPTSFAEFVGRELVAGYCGQYPFTRGRRRG